MKSGCYSQFFSTTLNNFYNYNGNLRTLRDKLFFLEDTLLRTVAVLIKVYIDFMNQINKFFFLSLIFLCFGMLSLGQITQFERLGMVDGLSSSTVYCIKQDAYGFIWMGTDNGLNIYNGNEFKHFFSEPRNTTTLSGNVIVQIVFDDDTAFVATSSGLCMMDVVTKKCSHINIGAHVGVGTLLLYKEANLLWVGTTSGLIKYDIGTKQIKVFNSTNSNISHDLIRSIYKDSDGNFMDWDFLLTLFLNNVHKSVSIKNINVQIA